MKTPKLLTTFFAHVSKRTKSKLDAATAAARSSMDGYDADEPTTKLSSAFVVVLILHVVAVGGIYAFNSIKASRVGREAKPAEAREEATKPLAKTNVKVPAISEAVAAPAPRIQTAPLTPFVPTVNPKTGLRQHLVKQGENPTTIAAANGVKTEELLSANNLRAGSVLHPGDTLAIPKAPAKPAPAESRKVESPAKRADVAPTKTTPGVHIVKKNETATSIAKVYRLTAADLLKLNKISDPTKIREGQPLTIPKKKE